MYLSNLIQHVQEYILFDDMSIYSWGIPLRLFDIPWLEIVFRNYCSIWCWSWPITCVQHFRSFTHSVFSGQLFLKNESELKNVATLFTQTRLRIAHGYDSQFILWFNFQLSFNYLSVFSAKGDIRKTSKFYVIQLRTTLEFI
jgi:hypothetical protein